MRSDKLVPREADAVESAAGPGEAMAFFSPLVRAVTAGTGVSLAALGLFLALAGLDEASMAFEAMVLWTGLGLGLTVAGASMVRASWRGYRLVERPALWELLWVGAVTAVGTVILLVSGQLGLAAATAGLGGAAFFDLVRQRRWLADPDEVATPQALLGEAD